MMNLEHLKFEKKMTASGMCILIGALAKTWWLLALCGIIDAICAAMNLLMLNPDGSLSLRRFALPNAVWDMSMLALVAGACAITAGLWNSGSGNSWLYRCTASRSARSG